MNKQEQLDAQQVEPGTGAKVSFEDMNLIPEVAQAIKNMGFTEPSPIQVGIYQLAMAGKDVIAMAQTGTGKTAAFGIPLAQRLNPNSKEPQALILAPTRELALQVGRELTQIGEIRGIKSVTIYGGASFTKQVEEVNQGVQIAVGTPGRVLDHIRRGTISFKKLTTLILDEADEMLSMGFEKEISAIIESLPAERQTMLFSATIPDDIRRLAKRYMGDATIVSVSGDHVGAQEVSHFMYMVSGRSRMEDMIDILQSERPESALIFCNTKDETQSLSRYLQKAGFDADWLNSDLTQAERERIMERTHKSELKYLVATDVAARGIDISHISHVINFSFPDTLETYIHRTGRTGRMGRQGAAISLIAPQDLGNLYYLRLTYKIFPIEKSLPDKQALARNAEIDKLDMLRRKSAGTAGVEFERLARRLMQDVQAERIIGSLLSDYFGGKLARGQGEGERRAAGNAERRVEPGTQNVQAVTDAGPRAGEHSHRPAKKKAPTAKPQEAAARPDPIPPKVEEKEAGDAADASHDDRSPWSPGADRQSRGPEQNENEIFVDAGRKDGLRIATLMQEIVRITGLSKSAVGRIRMLTRATFISVANEHLSRVLEALGQIEVNGRRLKAEPKA